MRWMLLASIASAAVLAGGAGAGSAGERQVPSLPATPPVLVSYDLRATFTARLHVSWREQSGDPNQRCSTWAEADGFNIVKASTVKPIRGFLQIFKQVQRTRGDAPWAVLVAVGKAKGSVQRNRTERSGVNWSGCTGPAPRAYEWPPSTCGIRDFTASGASLTASWRVFGNTLEEQDSDPNDSDNLQGLARRSIDVAAVPLRPPLAKCPMPKGRALLADAGLTVSDKKLGELRRLRRGRSVDLRDSYGGACSEKYPRRECSFAFFIDVTLTRV